MERGGGDGEARKAGRRLTRPRCPCWVQWELRKHFKQRSDVSKFASSSARSGCSVEERLEGARRKMRRAVGNGWNHLKQNLMIA